jgi:hypothetical protein
MWPILDTTVVPLSVEGMVCEEQVGRVNIYNILYCIFPRVSPPWFLTLWGPENTQALLRTPASAHVPAVTFLSSSQCLKKREKQKGEEINERESYG